MGMPSTQVTVAKAAKTEPIHFIQSQEFQIFFLNTDDDVFMIRCRACLLLNGMMDWLRWPRSGQTNAPWFCTQDTLMEVRGRGIPRSSTRRVSRGQPASLVILQELARMLLGLWLRMSTLLGLLMIFGTEISGKCHLKDDWKLIYVMMCQEHSAWHSGQLHCWPWRPRCSAGHPDVVGSHHSHGLRLAPNRGGAWQVGRHQLPRQHRELLCL